MVDVILQHLVHAAVGPLGVGPHAGRKDQHPGAGVADDLRGASPDRAPGKYQGGVRGSRVRRREQGRRQATEEKREPESPSLRLERENLLQIRAIPPSHRSVQRPRLHASCLPCPCPFSLFPRHRSPLPSCMPTPSASSSACTCTSRSATSTRCSSSTCAEVYRPFLERVDEREFLPVVLHISGPAAGVAGVSRSPLPRPARPARRGRQAGAAAARACTSRCSPRCPDRIGWSRSAGCVRP